MAKKRKPVKRGGGVKPIKGKRQPLRTKIRKGVAKLRKR